MARFFIHSITTGVIIGASVFNFSNHHTYIIPLYLAVFLIFLICLLIWALFKNKIAGLVALAFFFSTLTIWSGGKSFHKSEIAEFAGEKISLVGEIVGEIDKRESYSRITVKTEMIEHDSGRNFTQEKVIITTGHYPELLTGQKIKSFGKINLPENFLNENEIEFDYIKFLAKDGVYSLMYYPKIEILSNGELKFERLIFSIKQKFIEKINQILPSPEAELLGGILLGAKRSLGAELENNFRKVGLVHIIVLSGYNVTIIAEAILKFFSFLPSFLSAIIGASSIIVFSVMVGSGATVIRSTIMTLLALTARISGRTYSVNRALFLAGSVMILINPMILFYDPSFQLSFTATLGLINLNKFVQKLFGFIPEKFNLREITTSTFSTQIAVLPLLMKMTGQLSVVAPIVNIITLQFIPLTMLLGFLAAVLAFLNQTLGMFVGFAPYLFLKYILIIVNSFAKLEFATINL
ncbi:MAG TPA: ComEC/Rec2 family competence protein [Candidatus Paceibacterota bacterium]|nr:ComEC/Rec2 family competence protein [Candidatus Paceibacterota bacterium]HRZ34274.1 ComEC/Rec2 family competence protein [Candidatus Paceibacterota bacterium]